MASGSRPGGGVVDSSGVDARWRSKLDAAAAHAPGWLTTLGGLAILSAVVLAPAHEALRETRWRAAVMRAHATHFESLADRYRTFHAAIQAGEPVLLERLAYAQFRLQPADKSAVPTPDRSRPGGAIEAGDPTVGEPLHDVADVHAWLHEPLPRIGEELAPHRPIRSRLSRLASGHTRLGLIIAGGLLLLGGLMWTPRSDAGATSTCQGSPYPRPRDC